MQAKYQCHVIEDDIYAECSFSVARPLPIQYWTQQGLIYCGSVSKIPISHVGWSGIPPRLKHLYAKLIIQNISVNTPLQLGAGGFILQPGIPPAFEPAAPETHEAGGTVPAVYCAGFCR